MARFVWQQNKVIALQLKDKSYILGQLLMSPYFCFFASYRNDLDWAADAAKTAPILLICAVARQFTRYSPIAKLSNMEPRSFAAYPRFWLKSLDGSREVTVLRGTPRERTMLVYGDTPGGNLVEDPIDARGAEAWKMWKVIRPVLPDDDVTIDTHELSGIHLFPELNERLYLCKKLGRNVDPAKDLDFGRKPRREFSTYYDMLAFHGKPEDWGYSSKPYEPKPLGKGRRPQEKEASKKGRPPKQKGTA